MVLFLPIGTVCLVKMGVCSKVEVSNPILGTGQRKNIEQTKFISDMPVMARLKNYEPASITSSSYLQQVIFVEE